jgi:hypothetical protein
MKTEIKVRPNKAKRTFTITSNGTKYKTTPMIKGEFENCLFNTPEDWRSYLRTSQNYFLIK